MTNMAHQVGVARQIGKYSDAVEAPAGARWLYTSGTPGLAANGTLPADIAGQSALAWSHIVALLARAGTTVHDIVKINQFLLHETFIADYVKVRSQFLGDARPASTLLVVPPSVRPEFLLEVEAIAAKV